MTGVISDELTLKKGRNLIDFINGTVTRMASEGHAEEVTKFNHYGAKLNIEKIRSLFVYTETDAHVEVLGGNIEFDMMSFNKVLRGYELETILVDIHHEFVPDKNKFIFVASDNPYFDFEVSNAVPHMFYTNELTDVDDSAYQDLFMRHTLGEKFKVQVFNNLSNPHPAPVDLTVDIQHRELDPDDAVDQWVSYPEFPMTLTAGNVLSFGDDASIDYQHHFQRVRVKTVNPAQSCDVDGVMLNI